ncbi:hypothetical protein HDE_10964 [Halotydeus destructor]|nr:hypothetical protein HDE_10964 [Halotydeus destructor]
MVKVPQVLRHCLAVCLQLLLSPPMVSHLPVAQGSLGPRPGLGGLFAGGMPKLKATGNKLIPIRDGHSTSTSSGPAVNGSKSKTSPTSRSVKGSSSNNNNNTSSRSAIKASLEQQFGGAGLSVNSSKNNATANSSSSPSSVNNSDIGKFNTINVTRVRDQKSSGTGNSLNSDMGNGKGPAPSVPSANGASSGTSGASVQRSNSQNQGKVAPSRPGVAQKPSLKPPPPPKAGGTVITINGQSQPGANFQMSPPLPLKPPNVNRRQSFNGSNDQSTPVGGNLGNRSASNSFSDIAPPLPAVPPPSLPGMNGTLKPAPPPRNNSVPNGLNNQPLTIMANQFHTMKPQKTTSSITSINETGSPRMSGNTSSRPALGPPPPPPPSHTRNLSSTSSIISVQSAYSVTSPTAAPPPPPPPPSQLRVQSTSGMNNGTGSRLGQGSVMSLNPAPAPPTRHTSITKIDLESRFMSQFKEVLTLPRPDQFDNKDKRYPSQLQQGQSRSRGPPPPPPPSSVQNSPHLPSHTVHTNGRPANGAGMNGNGRLGQVKISSSSNLMTNGQHYTEFAARC